MNGILKAVPLRMVYNGSSISKMYRFRLCIDMWDRSIMCMRKGAKLCVEPKRTACFTNPESQWAIQFQFRDSVSNASGM